ncbi:Zn-ribbon domain-containing OB-fold protein [Nocardia sp. NBC_00416]|uniref:Zn-ribbon domain-containing OB-fold protein n=1 Tax=Nocardia sp. NBC_00416 TaxID=2975991 RepID=UPI002E1EE3F6
MYEWNPVDIGISVGDYSECAENALILRRCASCTRLFAPPVSKCSSCRSDEFDRLPATGHGSIVCWRKLRRAAKACAEAVVSTIAIVELDEGPWMYTTIEGELPGSSPLPVRVQFRAPPREDRFPVFAVDPVQP